MSRPDDARMLTFWQHLGELRARLLWSLGSIAVMTGVSFLGWRVLYGWLAWPLSSADPSIELNYLAPQDAFVVAIRLAFCGGLVLASPFVLWQLWAFIAPGLTPGERHAVRPILPVVISLFILGVLFVYFALLPASLRFLLSYAQGAAEAELTLERYFGFVTTLCLAGGFLFELPAVLAVLGYLRLVRARQLWRQTGWALVGLMSLAAVITPTGDAFNMLVLTAPLLALYMAGTGVVWLLERLRRE